ncbi:MAG: L-serine ammonia-lyase, iron-sulfur-dependent subunit beta [Peptoniphilaceae bacterium]|nr:L-serine ammonia-lyase, iron-sulfur-dependent subunit beta [Peptoniphilaceae bacterium]MDY6018764.1 L-serine ammonia-lyase, iron-sulfur-dependent subunit beta [Anaerococcus sp.]
MPNLSVFDIVGPIMIGPSSSHTAGANRIANIARNIAGVGFNKVDFYLHGSFAKTYRGHGTDRALVGGILGFGPDDERLRNSFEIAKEKAIEFNFIETDLGNVHPNTVKIVMTYPDGSTFDVQGSSIGGGNIKINKIYGNDVEYSGKNPTLIATYKEQKGMIAFVSSILYDQGYNIFNMRTIKDGEKVMLVTELDQGLRQDIYEEIKNGKEFIFIKYLG